MQLKKNALYVRQPEEASYFASDITPSFIAKKLCIANLYDVPTRGVELTATTGVGDRGGEGGALTQTFLVVSRLTARLVFSHLFTDPNHFLLETYSRNTLLTGSSLHTYFLSSDLMCSNRVSFVAGIKLESLS